MMNAVQIYYSWKTCCTAENPYADLSVIALNGYRWGKPRIISDDFNKFELVCSMYEEFAKENSDFTVEESILYIYDPNTKIM